MEDETKETNETSNEIKEKNIENEVTNNKSKNKSFIIKYIVFVIILICITAGACYYTIVYQNKNKGIDISEGKIEDVTKSKPKAEDSIYAINSYSETYNENPITVEKLYYKNGEVYAEWTEGNFVEFIQIKGLKDKSIEEKINNKFKDAAEDWKDIGTSAYTYVAGNFSNILSVQMSYYYDEDYKSHIKTFNIDLNTGDEIPFEKVFVSSAPIKSMLIEGLYEDLSWNNKRMNNSEETWEDAYNMDNVDTSDYEDKSLLLARKYDKKKDNLEFTISPTMVTVFGLIDKDIINEDPFFDSLAIKLYKYKEEVAIYKRYLSRENIYEDNSLGMKNIIVFTDSYYKEMYRSINYGKISDNVFLEEVEYLSDEKNNIAEKFIEKKSKELYDKLINETPKDKGVICQRICSSHLYHDYLYGKYTNEYIGVSFETHTATCSEEYFEEDAFRDYIKMKSGASASPELKHFYGEEWAQEQYPNLTIKSEYSEYYLDKNGNIVATSYEEMEQLITKKIEEEKAQQQIDREESVEENPEVLEENNIMSQETNTIDLENIITNTVEESNTAIDNNEVETNNVTDNEVMP